MPSEPVNNQPSLARTGAKAGVAFAGSVIKGGGFFRLLSEPAARAGRSDDACRRVRRHRGGAAAVRGGLRDAGRGTRSHTGHAASSSCARRGRAQRLGGAIAGRIESIPRTHGTLQRATDWLSIDALSKQLAPVLDEAKAARSVVAFVVNRLPMSEMLAEWQEGRTAHGEPVAAEGVAAAQAPALRTLLTRRINETLQENCYPLAQAAVHRAKRTRGALLGVGLWLVNR